jgi:hypothetical protein
MSSKPTTLRKVLTVTLMLTVCSFYSLVTTTTLAQTSKVAGDLSVTGQVTLNGAAAISGATVFSDSRVKTGQKGGAIVNLGRLGRIDLGPDTEMTLSFSESTIGGNLLAGRAVVSAPTGVGISVTTSDGAAVADGKQATALTVDVTCGNTRVASSRGEAKVNSSNKVEYVAAGHEVAVGTQTQGSRCTRLTAAGAAGVGGGLSSGALAALVIAGVGGAVGGIVAASQSDNVTGSNIVVSGFRP